MSGTIMNMRFVACVLVLVFVLALTGCQASGGDNDIPANPSGGGTADGPTDDPVPADPNDGPNDGPDDDPDDDAGGADDGADSGKADDSDSGDAGGGSGGGVVDPDDSDDDASDDIDDGAGGKDDDGGSSGGQDDDAAGGDEDDDGGAGAPGDDTGDDTGGDTGDDTGDNDEPAEDVQGKIDGIVEDMTLPHEGRPALLLAREWREGPWVRNGAIPRGFRAFTVWGLLGEAAGAKVVSNVRVHLRGLRAYILGKTSGQWQLAQADLETRVAVLREKSIAEAEVAPLAEVRAEADGGVSVAVGDGCSLVVSPGSVRAPMDPKDVQAVLAIMEARLVLDDPQGLDQRDQASYLLGLAGDYWLDIPVGLSSPSTRGLIGGGRFKHVSSEWRTFAFMTLEDGNPHALSEAQLRANPPPLE